MLKCLHSTNSSPSYNSLQNYRISASDFDHRASNKSYSKYRNDITTSNHHQQPTSPLISSSPSSSLESLTLSPSRSSESMDHIGNSGGFLNVSGPYRPTSKQSPVPLGHASPHGRIGNPPNRNLPHHHHLAPAGSRVQSHSSVPTARHSMQRSPSLSPNMTFGRSQHGSPQFLATNAFSDIPLVTSPALLESSAAMSSGNQTVFDPFVNMISDLVLDDYTADANDVQKGYDGLKPADLYSLSHSQMTSVNDNLKIHVHPSHHPSNGTRSTSPNRLVPLDPQYSQHIPLSSITFQPLALAILHPSLRPRFGPNFDAFVDLSMLGSVLKGRFDPFKNLKMYVLAAQEAGLLKVNTRSSRCLVRVVNFKKVLDWVSVVSSAAISSNSSTVDSTTGSGTDTSADDNYIITLSSVLINPPATAKPSQPPPPLSQPSVQVIKAFLPLLHALCHARTKYHPPIRTPAIGPILKPYFSRGELPYKKLSHYLEHAESNGVVKLRRLGVNGDVEVWATSFVETTDIWLAVRSQYPIFKGEGDDPEESQGNSAVEPTTVGSNSDRLSVESLARERCDSGISSIGSTQSAVSWSNFHPAASTSTSFVRTSSPFVHPVNAMVSPLTTPTITFSLPPPFPTSPSSSMQFSLLPPPLQTSNSVPSFGDLHRSNPRSPNVQLFPQHHNSQHSHSVQPIKRPPSYGSLNLNSPRDFHMHPQSSSFFTSGSSASSSALKPPTSNVPSTQHLMLPPQSRPAQSASVPCLSSLWDPSATFCTEGKNDGSDYSEFDSDDDGLFMNISRKNHANGGIQHKKQHSRQQKLEISEAQNTVFSLWTSPTFNSTPHPESSTTNSVGYNMWGSNGSSL